MFESSIKDIESVRLTLEERMKEYGQLITEKRPTFDESKKRNQKIIDSSKTSGVEKLRALLLNVIDCDELVQLMRIQQTYITSTILATSVQIFQNEVAMEFHLLKAKEASQISKPEELKKYTDMENEVQKLKSTINEEWKPLMDGLKDEIDRRSKYLDEYR